MRITQHEADLDDELEDTPGEIILENFREAWRDALAGKTRPIEVLFAELAVENENQDNAQNYK